MHLGDTADFFLGVDLDNLGDVALIFIGVDLGHAVIIDCRSEEVLYEFDLDWVNLIHLDLPCVFLT